MERALPQWEREPLEGGGWSLLPWLSLQCLPSADCPLSVTSDSGICSESRCGLGQGGISANKGIVLMAESPDRVP